MTPIKNSTIRAINEHVGGMLPAPDYDPWADINLAVYSQVDLLELEIGREEHVWG